MEKTPIIKHILQAHVWMFQVRLQPHGISFLRPVYLEMKDVGNTGHQLLVYHKEVDVHTHTDWHDITPTCKPKFM